MRFREEVFVDATPDRVWELIADPLAHGQWNPRVVATEVVSSGVPALGSRYRVTYQMSGKRFEYDADVVEFSPLTRWAARFEARNQGDGRDFRRFMTESYSVIPHGPRVQVVHDVDVDFSGVNFCVRALIWLIQRTGHPVERTILQGLAEIAEATPSPDRSRVA
jgi:hypothetical protein